MRAYSDGDMRVFFCGLVPWNVQPEGGGLSGVGELVNRNGGTESVNVEGVEVRSKTRHVAQVALAGDGDNGGIRGLRGSICRAWERRKRHACLRA